MARIIVAAIICPVLRQNLRHRLLAHRQNVQPQQNRPQPVLFADMIRPGAETFLATDGRPPGIQQVAKEFPPGRGFKRCNPQPFGNPVSGSRGRHRPRHPLQPGLVARCQMRIGSQHRQAVRRRDIDAPPHHHVAVAIAIGCGAKIRGIRPEHLLHQRLGPGGVGVGMHAAKVWQRGAVDHGSRRCPQPFLQDFHGIGAGHRTHAVHPHPEPGAKHRPDRGKIEQAFHQRRIIGHRVHHIHHHRPQHLPPDPGQIDILRLDHLVFGNHLGAFKHRLGHRLWCRTTVRHVELHPEILIRPTGVVAGRHDDAAVGLVQPDQVRRRRGGQQRPLPHDHPRRAIGGSHPQDHLRRPVIEIAPVAAQHETLACCPNHIENRLDKVLQIMPPHEHRGLLAQTRGAGFLPVDRLGGNCVDGGGSHGFLLTQTPCGVLANTSTELAGAVIIGRL